MNTSFVRWATTALSNTKAFTDPVIGNSRQNQLGLHCARIVVSDALHAAQLTRSRRRAGILPESVKRALKLLRRDGFVALPNYLPEEQFVAIYAECKKRSLAIHAQHALVPNLKPGTGHSHRFAGGVDRYDGATTNRFIDLDATSTPRTLALTEDPRFRAYRLLLNASDRPLGLSIYENVHGDESLNHDVQKDIHRDTFHHTYKLWFYLDDVGEEDGPFRYCPGSHRLNLRRLLWEYERSNHAARGPEKGGAFRATEEHLCQMGLPPMTSVVVQRNTLLLADTRGFHCRGAAAAGARRFALYATLRPAAFPFVRAS